MLFFVDARILPGVDIEPHLADEIAAVKDLRAQGFIEQLFRRDDGAGAYLLVEAGSAKIAQETLDGLPFPRHGLMTMRVEPVERL
jgi:hypothetical protein